MMLGCVTPPTEKSQILRRILIILMILTQVQGLFLSFTYEYKASAYFASFFIYIIAICRLSYFCCILNQFISIALIWSLLLEMAIKLRVGLYQVYLSSQGLYKMSSLIFAIISLYFNFVAYKDFKQIAFEIYEQENIDNFDRDREREKDRERDWDRNYD